MFDVPFIRPRFPQPDHVAADVSEIVRSNWFTNFGPREREFRAAVADYVGSGVTAVTFSNATVALTLALTELLVGREPGFVLVPSFTFAAGPQAIRWAAHEPLFIDIEPHSLQPSIDEARQAFAEYGDRIVAILYCNTFGIGGSINEWEALASNHEVPLIIDSAAGFGSRYSDGSVLGSRGTCEVFSFHATKPLAIGEGGAVSTRDYGLSEKLTRASNFGFDGPNGAITVGTNGKLQEINAAIGLRQLITFDEALEERRALLQRYHDVIAGVPDSYFPTNDMQSSVCFASIVLSSRNVRDSVLEDLRSSGIEARTYYTPPVHLQPIFAGATRSGSLEVTADIHSRIISLPVFPSLPESVFDRLGATLKRHAA